MAKYLHIQVNAPCHEKWENMQASASGSFCNSCQKTVIDFSNMSDSQLIEYFKKPVSNICGRFHNDQLDHELEIPVKKIPWLKYFFQVSIPALLFNYKANAQQLLKKNTASMELFESKSSTVNLRGAIIVNGHISNSEGQPVPGASVMIEGTNKGIAADDNGVFTLQLAEGERSLEITAAGYKKKLVPVNNHQVNVLLNIPTNDNVVISSGYETQSRRVSMGGAISSITVYNILGKKEIKDTASKTLATVELFPNPLKRNGILTIQWKKPVSNDQLITIYNAAGQKFLEKTIHTNQPLKQSQLNPGLHAGGYYIIHVIDAKTHDKQVISFIVE